MGGFAASLYPFHFLKAFEDEDADNGSGDDDEDKDEDASSSDDEEMTASQWLTPCHSWQKGEVVLGWE